MYTLIWSNQSKAGRQSSILENSKSETTKITCKSLAVRSKGIYLDEYKHGNEFHAIVGDSVSIVRVELVHIVNQLETHSN